MTRWTAKAIAMIVVISLAGPTITAGATTWLVHVSSTSSLGQARSNGLSAPSGGATTSPTATSLHLSWTAPTTGAAPSGYTITRNGAAVPSGSGCYGMIASTSCTDSGLSANATYTYTLSSVLGSHWASAASTSFQGTTFATVALSTAGTHTLSVPVGVTTFSFTMKGAGVRRRRRSIRRCRGTVTGTITIP